MILSSFYNTQLPSEDTNWSQNTQYNVITPGNNTSGMVVRTLQIKGGQDDCIITILRQLSNGTNVMQIKVNLPAHNYLILWEGFIYFPPLMGLKFKTDKKCGVQIYASVINQAVSQ